MLPDIGGHLYTCIDKISGQSMFYANPSIKKAKIGYRGAWAAFGVEFNFPVSHNWVSMSPVDFAYAAHEDGSASVWVSNIDREYGMQWQVELVLKPGSTLLEERVTLYNPSDCATVTIGGTTQECRFGTTRGLTIPCGLSLRMVTRMSVTGRGPAGEGKDLSLIKNRTDGPVSYFVHGSHEPFMAIWNPHTGDGYSPLRRVF